MVGVTGLVCRDIETSRRFLLRFRGVAPVKRHRNCGGGGGPSDPGRGKNPGCKEQGRCFVQWFYLKAESNLKSSEKFFYFLPRLVRIRLRQKGRELRTGG